MSKESPNNNPYSYTIDNFNTPPKMSCQEWNSDFSRIDEVDLNYIYDMLEKI